MELAAFCLALGLLLAVPGPTNMLLAMAGAERGLLRALPLCGVVVLGYLASILPVFFLVAPWLRAYPVIGDGLKLVAAAFVVWLAIRLWVASHEDRDSRAVSTASLFLTTLVNPKGLVIALAILPPSAAILGAAVSLAVLSLLVAGISVLWISLGATAIRQISLRHPVLVARLASTCLILFGAGLAARAVGLG